MVLWGAKFRRVMQNKVKRCVSDHLGDNVDREGRRRTLYTVACALAEAAKDELPEEARRASMEKLSGYCAAVVDSGVDF